MDNRDRSIRLNLLLAPALKDLYRLRESVQRLRFELHFYTNKLEMTQENLDYLNGSDSIVSLSEYKKILREHDYNRASVAEIGLMLGTQEKRLAKIQGLVDELEEELDRLDDLIRAERKVLPFTKRNDG